MKQESATPHPGYTTGQLARLSGVSRRALQYYDDIGLLCPVRAENGYRLYGEAQLARLQQILFYRTLGMPLADIAQAVNAPNFSAANALAGHLAALREKRRALDTLIATAEKTMRTLKGEDTMSDKEKFDAFKQQMINENEQKYGAEVREKYGDKTIDASNAKMLRMSEEEYRAFEALGQELNETLAAAVAAGEPAGALAQKTVALHKQWLQYTWPSYSAQAHRGLADMYVADERFTAYYEQIAPGAAQFLRDAIYRFSN